MWSYFGQVLPYDHVRTTPTKRVQEGQARAKYNFIAQTGLELSLAKGECKQTLSTCRGLKFSNS